MIKPAIIYAASPVVLDPAWRNYGLWLAVTVFIEERAFTLVRRYPRLVHTSALLPAYSRAAGPR